MKESKKGKSRHWLQPLKGDWRGGHHLLLWPLEEMHGKRVRALTLQALYVRLEANGDHYSEDMTASALEGVDSAIAGAARGKGTLTIWIPGGWDHLVLTGLADLMDQGVITWRYCSLESHRVLIRGLWRSKSVIITSLANWTGGTWEQWRSKTTSRDMALFAETFQACASLSRLLNLGSLAPSAGAGGLLMWRSWLGPRVRLMRAAPSKQAAGRQQSLTDYVAPLPSRPERCRHAERHTAYGLVHRQMRRGLTEGPIYCVDLREAYLCGLMSAVIPTVYSRVLHQPSSEELATALDGHTACALVQVRSPERPYPARRNGRVLWSTGEFWTWLAGTDLANALAHSHVASCKCAHLWIGIRYHTDIVQRVLTIGHSLDRDEAPLLTSAWRSLYAHLIGRFAAWRRRWINAPAQHNFGRWAYWHGVDAETGQVQAYRSVAGQTQKLQARTDSGDSVALLFAVVTAQCRYIIGRLADLAVRENVLAIEADSLWLTSAGWQSLQRRCSECGIPPDYLRSKEVFERAWMTGQAIAVVEINGKKFIRCPGVPADIAVGTTGDVRWPQTGDWHADGDPDRKRGVRRTERRYSASEIIRLHSVSAVVQPYADEINDPTLNESLLVPLSSPETGAKDV